MTTTNDPDEIRAEIERTRAALSNDVDTLTETANPKNIAKRQVDSAKDAVVGLKDRVFGSDAADAVRGSAGSVKDAAGSVKDRAGAVGDAVTGAPDTAKAKTRGNPLAAGLIAFGAGLLVSSLIPSSQKEQDAVSGLQENLEPLKAKAAEAAKEIAGQLKEPALDAVESVKSTASEGAAHVKDEGLAAKDQVQGQVGESTSTVQQHVS